MKSLFNSLSLLAYLLLNYLGVGLEGLLNLIISYFTAVYFHLEIVFEDVDLLE
jgi:hypothetical protein